MCRGDRLVADFEAGTDTQPDLLGELEEHLTMTIDGLWVVWACKLARPAGDQFIPLTGGGGYPADESRLSDVGLSWMMAKLRDVGVQYVSPLNYLLKPDSLGQATHQPWKSKPFDLLPTEMRRVLPDEHIHEGVVRRWTKDTTYRPVAMQALAQKLVDTWNVDATAY